MPTTPTSRDASFGISAPKQGHLKAIAADPDYAQAYSGLADGYALLGSNPTTAITRKEAMSKARADALKGLSLDDTLAEAHTSLAFVYWHYDRNWPAAETEFQRALQLNPSYATAHHWYAFYLVSQGRMDQVPAEKDDPSSAVLQSADAVSTVAHATPSSTSTEVFVPRRRFQRGRLFVRGSRKKVWVGSFREDEVQADGSIKRIRRSVVLGETERISHRAALVALQPFLDRVNIAPPPLPKSGKTLLEAVAEWRIHIAPNLKPSTVRAAESHLKQHIIPHLGTLRLSEFTVKVVQAFSTGLISGRTRKTVENVLQTLFSILRTARRFGSAVPAVSRAVIVLPNGGISREVRFFDAEQVGKIVAAAKEPYSTMFAVLGMTGLRAGEMLGLKVSDLDFTRKVIHVRRSIDSRTRQEQTPKSRGSASDVPMPGALEKRLLEFLRAGYRENLNGYLFANRNGNPYSIGKVTEYGLRPALEKLKIERAGLHAFRHAAASELLEQGAPLTVVQRQLRHRDARTTLQKYGHVVGDAQRRAVETLAENIERHAAVELEPSAEMEPSFA